jgi:hypothetical protein
MTRIGRMVALAGATVLLGSLAVGVASAGAVLGYKSFCPSLGTALCTAVKDPDGVAVDNSSGSSRGDVWVAFGVEGDGVLALSKFDASGNLLAELGESSIPGAAQQIFGLPVGDKGLHGVAVDPATGEVYVASTYLESGQLCARV